MVEAGKKITVAPGPPARREGPQGAAHDRRGAVRPLPRRGPGQSEDRRDLRRGRRRDHREDARSRSTRPASRRCRSSTSTTSMSAPISATRSTVDKNKTREDALFDIYRVMRPGEPPTLRDRGGAVQLAVLRFRALRPLRGRPREDEHAARPRRRGHRARAAQGRHPRGHQDAGRPARRQGRDRRHRPSRQPPRALGRRADGEPVPHRPRCAWSARSRSACPRSISTPSCRRT